MGFFDRLFGRPSSGYGQQGFGQQSNGWQGGGRAAQQPLSADEQAVRRYQYLLATAPPDKIEQAHREAFEKLTPAQRQQVLQQLAQADPSERPYDDSPASLARSATRMEMRQPGSLYRTFGGGGMGGMGRMGGFGGMGGMGIGSVLLTSVAGAFIGSAIANEFFDNDGFMDWDTSNDGGDGFSADAGDSGAGADSVSDSGGDFFGGDFGGGDFGGGDFGGGDF